MLFNSLVSVPLRGLSCLRITKKPRRGTETDVTQGLHVRHIWLHFLPSRWPEDLTPYIYIYIYIYGAHWPKLNNASCAYLHLRMSKYNPNWYPDLNRNSNPNLTILIISMYSFRMFIYIYSFSHPRSISTSPFTPISVCVLLYLSHQFQSRFASMRHLAYSSRRFRNRCDK